MDLRLNFMLKFKAWHMRSSVTDVESCCTDRMILVLARAASWSLRVLGPTRGLVLVSLMGTFTGVPAVPR